MAANGPLIRTEMAEGGDVCVPARNRRKGARRTLCIVLTALAIAIILLLLVANVLLAWRLSTVGGDTCLQKNCIKTAAIILNSIDSTVDPCDDFYMYACGEWIRNNPLPDDQGHISNFMNLNIQLEEKLKVLLDDLEPHPEDKGPPDLSEAVGKVKNFYNICMYDEVVQRTWNISFERMQDEVTRWPVLHPQQAAIDTTPLEDIYAKLMSKYRLDSLFKISIQPDDKNSSTNIIFLDHPVPSFRTRDWWLNMNEQQRNHDKMAYQDLVFQVMMLLGADPTVARDTSIQILTFEDIMSNLTNINDTQRDIDMVYTKIKIGDMSRKYRNFDWWKFFQILYSKVYNDDGEKVEILDDTLIVMHGTEFLELFDQKIEELKQDRTKTLNYILWSWFYKNMLSELRDPFAMRYFEFTKRVSGTQLPSLPWHGCVRKANHYFPFATTRMYVRRYFDNEAKHNVEDMIKLITKAFTDLLDIEDWLSPETKTVANEKIDAIQSKIGYPDFIHDTDYVDERYGKLQIQGEDYFSTKFGFDEVGITEMLANIQKPVNRTRWTSGGAVVNAFYSPNTNEIIFPAGILQPVFYSPDYPWSMNFGGIGVVIGHEITHGFDDKGRLYDKVGNMRLWWDNATIEKFKEKTQCIEDQYSNYTLDGLDPTWKVNGKRTKGENIADNGGLKQAYRAYKEWEGTNGKEAALPGLDLTHDQLFFLNYAQIWCGTSTVQEAKKKLLTSEHSPPSVRVRGPVSNSDDFAEAFHCPVGSKMNPPPERKCSVW